MINKHLLTTLEERFDSIYYALDTMESSKDLYALVASTMYGTHYERCCEILPTTGEQNPSAKGWRNLAKQLIAPVIKQCGGSLYANETDPEYNSELLSVLKHRFDKLQAYLDRVFNPQEDDLYSFVASCMYDKDVEECSEFTLDGKPNPEGKDLRRRAKQFLLPVILECGGLYEIPPVTEDEVEEYCNEHIGCDACLFRVWCDSIYKQSDIVERLNIKPRNSQPDTEEGPLNPEA